MLGERIRELRKAMKITQMQLAAELNVANGTIAMWETEKREPDIKTIRRLADFFDVPVGYLLGEDEKKPTPVSEDGLDKEKGEWSTAWDQASPELRRAAMAVLRSAESHPDTQGAAPSDE